jgi:membrane protease YdiL (CAAX protease family)
MKTGTSLTSSSTIMAICAGSGLMFGLLWFGNQPLGILVGVIAGLIVGAIIQYQRGRAG